MKPRPWPRCSAASGPAVLAAVAVFALTLATPGTVSAQSPSGWKRGPQKGDTPQGEHGRSGPAGQLPAESAPPTATSAERLVFYSNLGLLESISREAVTAIADSLGLPPGSAVTLYASTSHEANWFVGNILGETLAERGYKVRILDWGPAPADGDSSSPSQPSSPAPGGPNHARLGGEQNPEGQGASPNGSDDGEEGDKNENVAAPADTMAANPDSVQAEADSVRGGPEGGLPDRTSPGEEPLGGEPPARSQGQPAESAVTPAPGRASAVAFRTLPAGEVLDLRLVEFGVSYSDVGRKMLFGPLRFTRVGGVYIQVTSLKGPEGELRQVLSAERHRIDRLSGSQRSLAEGASYPFNLPVLKSPGLGRYIEPTVVVGIVSSLVYLFYANQSSK